MYVQSMKGRFSVDKRLTVNREKSNRFRFCQLLVNIFGTFWWFVSTYCILVQLVQCCCGLYVADPRFKRYDCRTFLIGRAFSAVGTVVYVFPNLVRRCRLIRAPKSCHLLCKGRFWLFNCGNCTHNALRYLCSDEPYNHMYQNYFAYNRNIVDCMCPLTASYG